MEQITADNIAKEWAFKNDVKLIKYIASGGNGSAYEISDNKVLKITSHFGEAAFAYDAMLQKPTGYVQIHSVEMISEKFFIITMDKLNISSETKDTALNLFTFLDEDGFNLQTKPENINHLISKDEAFMFKVLYDIIYQNKSTFKMNDIHDENIGSEIGSDTFVIFDQFHLDIDIDKRQYSKKITNYKTDVDLDAIYFLGFKLHA